jgi:hypothetical protein
MAKKKKVEVWSEYTTIGPIAAIASAHDGGTHGATLYALDRDGRIWMLKGSYTGRSDFWEQCQMVVRNPSRPLAPDQEAALRKAIEEANKPLD